MYTTGAYIDFLKSGKFPSLTDEDLKLVLDRYLLTKGDLVDPIYHERTIYHPLLTPLPPPCMYQLINLSTFEHAPSIDSRYLLVTVVGAFPDCYESLATNFIAAKNEVTRNFRLSYCSTIQLLL